MWGSGGSAPADTWRRFAQPSWGYRVGIIENCWGGVCLNVGCIPTKALLRHAELVHILTPQADLFGIRGEFSFDYGTAVSRSRQLVERSVSGVHFLMRKNKITEMHG